MLLTERETYQVLVLARLLNIQIELDRLPCHKSPVRLLSVLAQALDPLGGKCSGAFRPIYRTRMVDPSSRSSMVSPSTTLSTGAVRPSTVWMGDGDRSCRSVADLGVLLWQRVSSGHSEQ